METLQLLLVAAVGFLSVRFLYKKYIAPKTTKGCGTDCGCS